VWEMPRAVLVNADSTFEWRVSPGRLTDELARFVTEAYADEAAESTAEAAST